MMRFSGTHLWDLSHCNSTRRVHFALLIVTIPIQIKSGTRCHDSCKFFSLQLIKILAYNPAHFLLVKK